MLFGRSSKSQQLQHDDYGGQLSSGDLSPVCRGGPASPPMPPCPPAAPSDPPKDRRAAGGGNSRKALALARESPPMSNGVNGNRTDEGGHENGMGGATCPLENGTQPPRTDDSARKDDGTVNKNGHPRPHGSTTASHSDGPMLRLPGTSGDIPLPQRLPGPPTAAGGGAGGAGGQRQTPLSLMGASAAGRLAMFGSADEHLSLFSDTGFPSRRVPVQLTTGKHCRLPHDCTG